MHQKTPTLFQSVKMLPRELQRSLDLYIINPRDGYSPNRGEKKKTKQNYVALQTRSFRDADSAQIQTKSYRSQVQHLRDEAGLGSRNPPTARSTPPKRPSSPRPGRADGSSPSPKGSEPNRAVERSGARGTEAGAGRGLTWRGGRSGARAAASAAAAPRRLATAPPDTAPQRSGRGPGGRRPSSSAPGPAAPAPPRAPAAAGSASALAAAPSRGRAGAAAHPAARGRAGPWPS